MYNYDEIKKYLKTEQMGRVFLQYDNLPLLQAKAKKISESCPNGMLVLVSDQESEKIKDNIVWNVDNDSTIFFSIIVKSKKDILEDLQNIGIVSLHNGIKELFDINDMQVKDECEIYVNNRKVANVFVDKSSKKNSESYILTYYIKLWEKDEYEKKVSLFGKFNDEEEDLQIEETLNDKEILIAKIINCIEIYYKQLISGKFTRVQF